MCEVREAQARAVMWRNSTQRTAGDHLLVPRAAWSSAQKARLTWPALMPERRGGQVMMLGARKAGGDLTSPKQDHILPYHLSKEATQDENFS